MAKIVKKVNRHIDKELFNSLEALAKRIDTKPPKNIEGYLVGRRFKVRKGVVTYE